MDLELLATASRLAFMDESIAGSLCFAKDGSSPSIFLLLEEDEEGIPDCES